MRVLTFTTLYPNEEQPGHGIFVEARLQALRRRHPLQLEVVAPVPWFPLAWRCFGRYARYPRVPRVEERQGVRVHHPRYPVIPRVGMRVAPRLLAEWSLACVRRLRADGPDFDVIDAHYFYPDGVAAALIAQRLDKPLLITARGSDVNLIARFAAPRRAILDAARQAHTVITVSEALRRALVALGVDAGRVRTLRNGVDLARFAPPADREALRASLGFRRPTVLSVGNLVALKGHDLVVEAVAGLEAVDLVVIGEGELRAALERRAATLGIGHRVRFTGRLPQEELARHYGAADALVLASSREGWANVLLEAMACGTPVVATAVGGSPEVVAAPEAGVLARERSAAGIREAVQGLLAAPPSRAAVRRYAQAYSWDATSDGLHRALADAAGGAAAAKVGEGACETF